MPSTNYLSIPWGNIKIILEYSRKAYPHSSTLLINFSKLNHSSDLNHEEVNTLVLPMPAFYHLYVVIIKMPSNNTHSFMVNNAGLLSIILWRILRFYLFATVTVLFGCFHLVTCTNIHISSIIFYYLSIKHTRLNNPSTLM